VFSNRRWRWSRNYAQYWLPAHRHRETCEAKYLPAVCALTDRIELSVSADNKSCYALAVEKLLGLEIPPKAQWLRV